ncbi:MAG: ROK family protein [Gaiellaceae bacterium]
MRESSSHRSASPARIRDLNQGAVLRLIAAQPRIARAEIARQLNLSPATVTAVTRRLLEGGLIRVVDRAPSSGGRPRLLLEIVGGAAHALGVKIAADHVTVVRVDLDAELLERYDYAFDAAAPDAVERLGELLAPLVEEEPAESLLGVGLGVPGVVGPDGRVDSPMLGWQGLPAAELLARRLGVPVLADNDVNTLAVAERLYGRGRDAAHFLTVTIGRGIGLGIVIDGNVYRGYGGGAGEFGHVTAVGGGEVCPCGKRGCLETVAADPALVASARRSGLLGPREGIEALRALADAGRSEALTLYEAAGRALGRSLADLVNVLGPELVLLSGEGMLSWPHLSGAVESEFRSGLFPPLRGVQLELDPWDDAKWARGAASLVLRPTLAPALHESRPDELVRARLAAPARAEVVA